MEEKTLESGRDEALIRVMLAMGRRLEVFQALKSWEKCRSNWWCPLPLVKSYEGWKGKAVSIGSSWRPKGVMLGAIAKMEWRIFSSRFPKGVPHIFEYAVGPGGPFSVSGFTVLARKDSCPVQWSRIEESMIVALHSPQHVVNANERNSPLKELCLVLYTNIVCKDLQQLFDRVGSQSTSAPIKLTFVRYRILHYTCAFRWARFGQLRLPYGRPLIRSDHTFLAYSLLDLGH